MSSQEHNEEGPQNRAGTVVRCITKILFPKSTPSCLATPPSTLHPAEYDISVETQRAQAERLAVRAQLKRESTCFSTTTLTADSSLNILP